MARANNANHRTPVQIAAPGAIQHKRSIIAIRKPCRISLVSIIQWDNAVRRYEIRLLCRLIKQRITVTLVKNLAAHANHRGKRRFRSAEEIPLATHPAQNLRRKDTVHPLQRSKSNAEN